MRVIECDVCRVRFVDRTRNQKRCSARCRAAYDSGRRRHGPRPLAIAIPCAHCGAEYLPRSQSGRFCTRACRNAWWRAERAPVDGGARSCASCHTEFDAEDRRQRRCDVCLDRNIPIALSDAYPCSTCRYGISSPLASSGWLCGGECAMRCRPWMGVGLAWRGQDV